MASHSKMDSLQSQEKNQFTLAFDVFYVGPCEGAGHTAFISHWGLI